MKIKQKYNVGGFIDTVDKSLDTLGPWGKLGVQALDPIGVTSWAPVKESLATFQKTGTLKSAGELLLNSWGAIPAIGMFARVSKLFKPGVLIKKSKYLLEPQFAKDLINPAKNLELTPKLLNDARAKQEAIRILDDEMNKIVELCTSKNAKKLSAEQENKITKLLEKRSILSGETVNPLEAVEEINKALA